MLMDSLQAQRRLMADIKARPFAQMLPDAAATAIDFITNNVRQNTGSVADAMAYAVVGGKGLRAFFVMETARLHRLDQSQAVPAAAAIECLHAYSLVHDDLPSMDDDDLRRGNPTVHRKWNEATAILAGDALQAMAFQCVAQCNVSADARIALTHRLAVASGIAGMVGGQAADIAAEQAKTPLSLPEITALQAGKTGALIKWSTTAGAVLAGQSDQALADYGDAIGLAFQIADDILDVEGDAVAVGKAVGKDADAGKATFVSLLGMDEAKSRAKQLVESACDALEPYADDAETLREAARFVITRTK